MSQVNYDLFVYKSEEGLQVWYGDRISCHEERYAGPWPVLVWFLAEDYLDGNGWGRSRFLRYAKVVESYYYDVGNGHQTQAVLGEVPSEEAFVSLVEAGFEPWEEEAPPEEL